MLEKAENALREKKGRGCPTEVFYSHESTYLSGKEDGAIRGKEEMGWGFWVFLVVFVLFRYKPLSLVGISN